MMGPILIINIWEPTKKSIALVLKWLGTKFKMHQNLFVKVKKNQIHKLDIYIFINAFWLTPLSVQQK